MQEFNQRHGLLLWQWRVAFLNFERILHVELTTDSKAPSFSLLNEQALSVALGLTHCVIGAIWNNQSTRISEFLNFLCGDWVCTIVRIQPCDKHQHIVGRFALFKGCDEVSESASIRWF